MDNIVFTTQTELEALLRKVLREETEQHNATQTYSISETSRMLKVTYNTIKKYCERGILKTTINKRIPESEIRRYLQLEESKEIQPRKRG
ncbi:MAG: helix-turn-helix domain-containing protein [Bacteroidales bacterium]|nr:helix-turn-helix domain-containing protein [Bacteroidales bacterium]